MPSKTDLAREILSSRGTISKKDVVALGVKDVSSLIRRLRDSGQIITYDRPADCWRLEKPAVVKADALAIQAKPDLFDEIMGSSREDQVKIFLKFAGAAYLEFKTKNPKSQLSSDYLEAARTWSDTPTPGTKMLVKQAYDRLATYKPESVAEDLMKTVFEGTLAIVAVVPASLRGHLEAVLEGALLLIIAEPETPTPAVTKKKSTKKRSAR